MAAGSKEARNKLIEHNLRLVAHIAKKYDNTFEDKDDILSIGMIGLIAKIPRMTRKNPGQATTETRTMVTRTMVTETTETDLPL